MILIANNKILNNKYIKNPFLKSYIQNNLLENNKNMLKKKLSFQFLNQTIDNTTLISMPLKTLMKEKPVNLQNRI